MTEGGMELPAPERPAAVAGEEKKEEEGLSAASEAAKKVALGGWTCPTNVVKGVRGFSSKVKEGEQVRWFGLRFWRFERLELTLLYNFVAVLPIELDSAF